MRTGGDLLATTNDSMSKGTTVAIIALLVLTPLLGYLAPSRGVALAGLVAVWAIIFPFQTHDVLRSTDGDLPDELGGTIAYFAVNYAVLMVAVFTTNWISRRRHRDPHPAVTSRHGTSLERTARK